MRPSLTRLLGSSLAGALLCLGTVAGAQEAKEGQFLRVQTPAQDIQVEISRNSIVGTHVQLVRDDDAIRGRAAGRSVYLRILEDEEELDGLAGSQPAWIGSVRKRDGSL